MGRVTKWYGLCRKMELVYKIRINGLNGMERFAAWLF